MCLVVPFVRFESSASRDTNHDRESPSSVWHHAVELLVMIAAVQSAWESQCKNNLKQLGQGFLNYAVTAKSLPPHAGTGGANLTTNREQLSGIVMTLPYFDQGPLWKKFSPSQGEGPTRPALAE